MRRPIHARIDLAALRHNHAVARKHAGDVRLWSVIKANAYGHGALAVAEGLRELADGFALIEMETAIRLRETGYNHPMLILEGFYHPSELNEFAEYQLTPVIHTKWQLDALIAARLPVRLPIYLKIDSGMRRLGISPDALAGCLKRIEVSRAVSTVTLMTHFADADERHGIGEQLARFNKIIEGLNLPVSIANSAALMRFPDALACGPRPAPSNWARPGIMLYGSSPFPPRMSAAELELKPVMTLTTEVIAVRDLAKGDHVGYGGHFVAPKAMRVGVVACGYADGYPRHAPTGTPVLVRGKRTRILGRVSMDKICVDLSDDIADFSSVGAGDTVLMWGGDDDKGLLPADEVAMAAGTISYEIFCALAARVAVEVVD